MSNRAPLLSEAEVERRAKLFNALGNKMRLRILELLSDREMRICEIVESLDGAESTVAYHLRTLKDAGLVTCRREGRFTYCAVEDLELAKHCIFEVFL